jgi:hypothetical protein
MTTHRIREITQSRRSKSRVGCAYGPCIPSLSSHCSSPCTVSTRRPASVWTRSASRSASTSRPTALARSPSADRGRGSEASVLGQQVGHGDADEIGDGVRGLLRSGRLAGGRVRAHLDRRARPRYVGCGQPLTGGRQRGTTCHPPGRAGRRLRPWTSAPSVSSSRGAEEISRCLSNSRPLVCLKEEPIRRGGSDEVHVPDHQRHHACRP